MSKKRYLYFLPLFSFGLAITIFPLLIANPYYISIMIFAGLYSLITMGLSLLMGYAGQISLGHAAFFGVGAYTSGILTVQIGLNPWAAMGMGVVVTLFLALAIAIPSLKLKGHYLALATLAFGQIMYIISNEITITGGASGIGNIPQMSFWGFSFDTDMRTYYLVWCFVILVLTFSLNFLQCRVGRALKSIGENEMAASTLGVPVARYKIQIFALSAIYGSLAGSLYAHHVTFISPSCFGLGVTVLTLTMVVVGGMYNVWGAILGATLLTIFQEVLRQFGDFDKIVYGLAVVIVLIFMPEGILFGLRYLGKRMGIEVTQ